MPGKPAARQGDMTAHGGVITVGAPTVLIGGQPAACVGDMHTCPMQTPGTPPIPHVGGPITGPGAPMVLICGKPAAVVGDMATCTGPPDSIIPPGCPTVLIGTGGGSGGGGGAGGGGQAEDDTKASEIGEVKKLDVKVTDKGGFPVTGLRYKVKAPDGEESEGNLAGKIQRVGQDGNYDIELQGITKCEWSAKSARDGEKVKMKVEAAGVEDKAGAIIQVWCRDMNRPDRIVKEFSDVKVSSGKAEAEWQYEYPENVPREQQEADRKYSLPKFYFVAKIGNLVARSKLLDYKDFIELSITDEEGNPRADEEYKVILSHGVIKTGKLDSNGYAKIEKVPPGPWSVQFPKRADLSEET